MAIKGTRYRQRQAVKAYLTAVQLDTINRLAEGLGMSASTVLSAGLTALNLKYIEMATRNRQPVTSAALVAELQTETRRLSEVVDGW